MSSPLPLALPRRRPRGARRSLSLMRAVSLVLVMLVAAVCGNFQHSPVAGPADVVAEACGVCADVWMKVRPRTGPNPILPALETGDNVSSECLQLVMDGGQPAAESLGVNPASCANYQRIVQCYSAVNRACVGCKQLSWRAECVAMDGDGKPSFCRGHSAKSAEEMSLAAWIRIFYWKLAHCTLPYIGSRPYPGDTEIFGNDFWFKHSRMAQWERQEGILHENHADGHVRRLAAEADDKPVDKPEL